MAYPTVGELVGASRVEALTSLTPEQQDSLRASSIHAIEEFCHQSFDFEAGVTRTLDGNGTMKLYLPRRLERITGLSVAGAALELGDVELSADGDYLVVAEKATSLSYYTQTLHSLTGWKPVRFRGGVATVSVTGDWGWPTPPPPIVEAIRKDMEDTALADSMALNDTIRAYRKLGIGDISQGDLRATMTFAPGLSDEVVGLIRPYVWQADIGAVI